MGIAERVLRSRLVHFLVAGALLFAVAPRERTERPIKIATGEIERAFRAESVRLGRRLEPAEKQRLLDELVADEVLYREGRRLGVDEGDPVVRGRVAESMRAALAATVTAVDPAEVDREAALLAAAAPLRVRAEMWFVAKDRPDAMSLATALAAALPGQHPKSPDQPPLAEDAFYTEEALARAAGPGVARAAFETPIGAASPPTASAWGLWIVRPLERRALAPGEVRGAAAEAVRRRRAGAEIERLVERARAEITVDVPLGEPPYRRGAPAATGAM